MTSSSPPEGQGGDLSEAVVSKRRGIPIIWIIPLVAVAVGGWLWWSAMQERGPTITIRFETADGLEAGKTKIKFKELEVGKVTAINLHPSLDYIVATAEMAAGSEQYMVDQTRFWVVRPRIGKGGVSGLSTIVSGAYINMDLTKEGLPTTDFIGLEVPPVRDASEEGLSIILKADSVGSVETGTAVYYRQVEVGQVERYRMLKDEDAIEFKVFIEAAYADLVRVNTHFWNTSGISMSLNAEGFDIHAESLDALLMGGIAFGVPPYDEPGNQAVNGMEFKLYPSREVADKVTDVGRRTILYFDEPVNGLKPGAIVDFRGIEIGVVLDVHIEFDQETSDFRTPVLVETYPGRLRRMGPEVEETHSEGIARLALAGLRGRLSAPNLITGARFVEIVFDRETPPVFRGPNDSEFPELPTIKSTGAAFAQLLDDLPDIVSSAKDAIEGVSTLVNSPDVTETLAAVRASSGSLQNVMADLEQQSSPLLANVDTVVSDLTRLLEDVNALVDEVQEAAPGILASVEETAQSANNALNAGEASMATLSQGLPHMQRRLETTLDELSAALRSVRVLAETIERQPEALLKGKGDD